ncbi:J domain-containing protein [Nannocystis bainbridge]|uniref:J domain-containing protein n=1 Tax=Nannocystis bainbridge TaxID=2995303 RepID=A0ABT5E168_9BACT|nr:J domain-containing protein [Nannocystis bainbridge]MDC0719565.1 J domain-containing protein [Nannocystis bainbridge]
MPAFVDHYRVLDVAPSASESQIRQAFRRAVHRHHADRHPDDASASERMRAVVTARDVLCDPQLRASFDRARAGQGAARAPVDPLFQAAARAWGQAPPPNPPAPPVQAHGWGAALAGAAGLAAAFGLSLLAAAGVAKIRSRWAP